MRERGAQPTATPRSRTGAPHPPRGMTYRFYIDSIIRTIRAQLRFLITKREVCKFPVDAHSSTPDASDVRVKPDVHRSLLRDCSRGPARSLRRGTPRPACEQHLVQLHVRAQRQPPAPPRAHHEPRLGEPPAPLPPPSATIAVPRPDVGCCVARAASEQCLSTHAAVNPLLPQINGVRQQHEEHPC